MSLTLVSFNICPYVFRAVAAMHYKKIEFEIKYIDLENRPDWFIKASPLEKVPILIVNNDKVLFESNVILDYIDVISPPSLQPVDPFMKSLSRARQEFSSELISAWSDLLWVKTEEQFKETITNIKWYFAKVENWLQDSKFLGGNEIMLIDFSYSSTFTVLNALKPLLKVDIFDGFPRLRQYGDELLKLPAVQQAKVADYDELIIQKVKSQGAYISL